MSGGIRMEFLYVPFIVILCYLFGDIYKTIFKKDEDKFKYIPLYVTIIGGVLGLVFYFFAPELIFNIQNPITALVVGIISGAASTGGNQIFKQLSNNSRKTKKAEK